MVLIIQSGLEGVMAEAQVSKTMAAKTKHESVLTESLLTVLGFNTKEVCDF